MSTTINILDSEYSHWLKDLCRIKAAVAVNDTMLKFYWSLGRDIVILKAESRWGSKFMANSSRDLKEVNPDAACFSPTNLLYMKTSIVCTILIAKLLPNPGSNRKTNPKVRLPKPFDRLLPNLGSKWKGIYSHCLGNITN